MKFSVTLDRDEDGVFFAECPSIPGCVSQAEIRVCSGRITIGAAAEQAEVRLLHEPA